MLIPWAISTALASSIVSVAVGFSPPTSLGSTTGHAGAPHSTPVSSARVGERLRVRCTRGIHARGGGDRHGRDGIRRPWRRSAMAIDGVEVEEDSKGVAATIEGGWGEQKDDGNVSYTRMLKFILPTLGIWLASPIMSLVDAGVVGTRSATELASLGPATVLCESLIYCSTFLAIAVTNLQATALADGKRAEAQKVVVAQALGLALSIGLMVAVGVQAFGPRVLAQLAGEKSKEVVPAALVYSRVRILGAPASIAAMVLQAACLGARDSVTPLGVVLIASAMNGLGDWVAVCRMGMGVFGAAAATASAETVSMVLLGLAVWRAQGERVYKFVELPSAEELKVFLDFAGPIAFALLGKVLCYSVMTITVTAIGPLPLATHNVMLRVFFFFATFGEALSQTAQAFIPGQLARERSIESAKKAARAAAAAVAGDATAAEDSSADPRLSPARTMMRKVLILGVGVGSLNACVAGLVPLHLPHLFTNSLEVAAGMRSLTPLLSWSLLTHACVMGLEGILLARRRLGFLAGCYAINTVVLVSFMQWVRTWPATRGLHGAWMGLLLLQIIRRVLPLFGMHLLWLNRRSRVAETKAAAAA
ncbi:unnamed protein product [Ectocarpus sp. 12 AP-2014]